MTIVIFIIVLAVLVLVHEFGHFIAAKISGIRVDEFGLGFPPRVVGVKFGETTYSINAIPFGGFVKIFGEDPDDESISGPDKNRSFFNKPKYIQIFVLAAGVVCNVIFAWFLISVGFMSGMPVPEGYSGATKIQNPAVAIVTVAKDSPAEKAGFKSGDEIVAMKSGADSIGKGSVEDVQNFINAHGSKPIVVNYKRGSGLEYATVTPTTGLVENKAVIGVTLEMFGTLKLPFFQSLSEGAKLTVVLVRETAVGLGTFVKQIVVGKAQFSQVTGPVGIAGLVGDATRLGFVYLLTFTALISVNLAIINIVPFPALDGGRILFAIIEKIKGSPIKPRVANLVNAVGFALLILLMLVVTFHDIFNLVR